MGIKRVIQNPTMVREQDFELPSATRQYEIGQQISISDAGTTGTPSSALPYAATYEYQLAGTTLQQYGVYTIQGASSGIIAGLITSAVTSAAYCRVIIPQTAVTNGYYFFGAVKGVTTMAHTAGAGQNMIAGYNFTLPNAATTATPLTAVHSAATAPTQIRQVNAVGFASGLSGTAANISVYLYGDAALLGPVINL